MHLPLSLLQLHKLDERQGNKLHAQSLSITEICYYKTNDQVTKLIALGATTHVSNFKPQHKIGRKTATYCSECS